MAVVAITGLAELVPPKATNGSGAHPSKGNQWERSSFLQKQPPGADLVPPNNYQGAFLQNNERGTDLDLVKNDQGSGVRPSK